MSELKTAKEISALPWRSVYPLGSKQRCAAIAAGDHYVSLYVAESDALPETVRMHQANADFIVAAVNRVSALETALAAANAKIERLREIVLEYRQDHRVLACCETTSGHDGRCSTCRKADEVCK